MTDYSPEIQEKINSWTKEQIYEAYIREYIERQKQSSRANMAERKLKEVEWKLSGILKSISVS